MHCAGWENKNGFINFQAGFLDKLDSAEEIDENRNGENEEDLFTGRTNSAMAWQVLSNWEPMLADQGLLQRKSNIPGKLCLKRQPLSFTTFMFQTTTHLTSLFPTTQRKNVNCNNNKMIDNSLSTGTPNDNHWQP